MAMPVADETVRQAYSTVCCAGLREGDRILFTVLSMSLHCGLSADTSKECCDALERMFLVEKCKESRTAVYKVLYPSEIARKKLDQSKH